MIGVNISIFQNEKTLLTKREDFEVWCLLGSAVDEGETIAQAAIREAREETGLDVDLTGLIGLYSRPNWPGVGHIASFSARVVGGELKPDLGEVIEMGFFGRDEIPEELLWWNRQRLLDAFDSAKGVVWSQVSDYPFEMEMTRAELYQMRDESRLTRRDFYFETLGKMNNVQEIREVG